MAESTEQTRGAPDENASEPNLAYRALLDHATTCGRCAVNWRECPTRRRLSNLLRDVRS